MVTESVVILFDRKIRIGRKALGQRDLTTRRMNVKQMNHRGRNRKFSAMS